MSYKWFGAILVIGGCGGFGAAIASAYHWELKLLRQLVHILSCMESELQYRLTPLPELCRQAGESNNGILGELFLNLSRELNQQISSDVSGCMNAALKKSPDLPVRLKKILLDLGYTLGKFDLSGQLQGLHAVQTACETERKHLEKNKDIRLRSYQTLGICAGLALVILFV